MIRCLLALSFLCLLAAAEARPPITHQDAVAAYEAGRVDAARTAFRLLAETGFADAQFRLGTLLVEGEGGPSDAVEGALWVRLAAAEGYAPAQQAKPDVMQALEPAQREEVENRLPGWQRRYSATALFQQHAPELYDDRPNGESVDLRPTFGTEDVVVNGGDALLHKRPPRYPRELRRRGIPGYVRVGAWLGADGEFENPHVIFSDPEWIFDQPALAALQDWRVEWKEAAPDRDARYVTQSIMFYIDGRSWERKARRQYERIIEDWDEDPAAGYRAARMATILGFGDLAGGHEGFVAKMHQSASNGLARAQIDLHDYLHNGKGVKRDQRAAAFWLQRAAFSGDALAQFLLSLQDDFGRPFSQALLHSAADQGSVPAIITMLRQQLASPESANRELLDKLVGLLPEFWYLVNPDQTLVEQAKRLVPGQDAAE